MGSFLCLALLLLHDPLSDLPQSLNREQRWCDNTEIRINWPRVVGQARCNRSVVSIGHANDEVGIWPTSNTNELDTLTMQGMVGMSDCHPFHRSFGKGGSVL